MKNLLCALGALLLTLAFAAATPAGATNCSSYPYTLTNGQTADATQVMANFNSILSCANTTLARSGANSDITSMAAVTITNSNLSTMAAGTLKGNITGSAAIPADVTLSALAAALYTTQPPPFEFYVFVGGTTGNAWTLANYVPTTALVLTTAKSACKVGTAATSTTTYTLKDNGASIGTAVVTGGGTSCAATITSSPYTFAAGHTLSVSGPTTGDATLADIGITFGGVRN